MTGSNPSRTKLTPASISDVIDRLESASETEETSLRDVVSSLGQASFVPVLMAPALAVVSPLSGIPFFSSASGTFIALVAGQLLLGRKHLWLPGWMMRRSVPTDRLKRAVAWARGPARWLDRHTGKRLSMLVRPPMDRLIYLACALCGAAMPLLELVPFSSSLLGAAVALLSLTVLARDGLLALAGFLVIGAAIGVVVTVF